MTVSVFFRTWKFLVMREWKLKQREIEKNFRVTSLPKFEAETSDPLEALTQKFRARAQKKIELPPIQV